MAPLNTPAGARRNNPSSSQRNQTHSANTGAGVASQNPRFTSQPGNYRGSSPRGRGRGTRGGNRRGSRTGLTLPSLETLSFVYGHPDPASAPLTLTPGGLQDPITQENDTVAPGLGDDNKSSTEKEGDGEGVEDTPPSAAGEEEDHKRFRAPTTPPTPSRRAGLQMKAASMPPQDSPEKARRVVSNAKLQKVLGGRKKK
ncbi:hypothetical protein PTMSG1_00247 [Pyrenophora teres f. maculata]|nr:hypothetical protein PTMSG1_00247 [Pyrenophora teres f. maculata]